MRALFPLLFLTACATPITPDARYIGTATPATPSELCKPGKAVLRLRNGQALFIPDETTWYLTGTATAAGVLEAERIGRSPDKQSYSTRLSGTWTEQAASGTYTTPQCRYAVQLARH